MHTPKVSIVTPTYNHEAFIEHCIDSVRRQTFDDWEMLIVDDGSTDGTWSLVERAAALDPRIRPFHQTNKGIWRLHETYNLALNNARGKLIAILEGDDYWPDDKLQVQIAHHSSNTVLSYGTVVPIASMGNHLALRPSRIRGKVAAEHFRWELLHRRAAVQPVSLVIDRAALERIGGFHQDGFFAVDLPTLLQLAGIGGFFVYVDHVLGFWRVHEAQMTQQVMTLDTKALEDRVEGIIRLRLAAARNYGYSEEQIAEVKDAARRGAADAYLHGVRQYFARRASEPATLEFMLRRLWRSGTRLRKAQAVYGFLCQYSGLDFEIPFRMRERLGRTEK